MFTSHAPRVRVRNARLNFTIVVLVAALVSLLPYVSEAGFQTESESKKKSVDLRSVPGEILVRFRNDASTLKSAENQELLIVEPQRPAISVTVERLRGPEVIEGLRIARVQPTDTQDAIDALRARPDVIYAEPNFIRRKTAVPNDSQYGDLWGLKNTGQDGGVAGVDINAEQAWDITKGSQNVVVAVIDEGIDTNHPDLQPNLWQNTGEVVGNVVDDDGNGFVDDRNGFDFVHNDASVYDGPGVNPDNSPIDAHGTHVAGTIGAQGNNGVGVVGVNWDVSLMSLKTLGPDGASSSDLIEAYSYAKMMRDRWVNTSGTQGANIRVTNNSYGGDGYSQAEADAISAMGSSGILFVASAGNDARDANITPQYPANYDLPNVISVASIDRNGALSSFSNYGSRLVHLGAPGGSITSTLPGNSYNSASGSSMASPHVAGVAALVLATHPNFSLSRLRAATLFGGTPTSSLETRTVTGRLVNALGSLQNANEIDTVAPAALSGLKIAGQDGRTVVLNWTASGDDGASGRASLLEIRFVDSTTNARFLLAVIKPAVAGTAQAINVNVPYRHANGLLKLTAIDNVGNATDTTINTSVDAQASDPYAVALGPAQALSVGGQELTLNHDDFITRVFLPFEFPFYQRFYNQVSISTNGAIYLEGQPVNDAGSLSTALNGRPMIVGFWDDIDLRKCFRSDSDVYEVKPDNDRVIFRWQGVKFSSAGCPETPSGSSPVNFEVELRRDGIIKMRYGQNTAMSPVVGIGAGEPDAYIINSHTTDVGTKDLTNAQSVTFTLRQPPPVADLAITSSVNPTIVQTGQTVTFELTVTNRGPSRTSGIVVTDIPPTGVPVVSCTVTQGSCSALGNGVLKIGVPILESGASATIKLVLQAIQIQGGFINTASVAGPITDSDVNNNNAQSVVQIVPINSTPQEGLLGISASGNQSFAIRSDRYGLAWGDNFFGQLGDGTVTSKALPIRISGVTSITAIDGGLSHTLALRQNGTVWSWGNNDKGQLGDGTTINHKLPAKIAALSDVTRVSGGGSHSMALKSDGTVWVWGDNSAGQLGDGSTSGSPTPKQVPGLSGVRHISAGVDHSLAVKTDGTVWAWGGNDSGQLGDATTTRRTSPVRVTGLTNVSVVSAGEGFSFFGPNGLTNVTFSVALRNDGTVWAWGHNWRGQLGDGTVINRSTPVRVSGLTGVTAIAAGGFHVLALRNDGTVWTWGGNFDGQLGDLSETDRLSPVRVVWLTGLKAIAAGSQHSLALSQDGQAFAWGSFSNGQLGFGATVGHLIFPYGVSAQIPDPPPAGVVSSPTFTPNGGTFFAPLNAVIRSSSGDLAVDSYFTGGNHNIVKLSDGSYLGWGSNSHGQLGFDPGLPMSDPNKTIIKNPLRVEGIGNVKDWAPGQTHNVILKTDGTVWTSGGNHSGQLGIDTQNQARATFAPIPGLTSVSQVAAGYDRSIALKTDGTVWAWGLGPINVPGLFHHSPQRVDGLSNVKAVACGAGFFAIRNDGTLWAWGPNYQGFLGDGTDTARPTPVQVVGINNALAVSSGVDHTVLLKSDGTVWVWGLNSAGQLGLGDDFMPRYSPVKVPGLSGVVSIAAGLEFTMALKSDGTVWAWGRNVGSELGDGTNASRRSPVQVPGLTDVTAIKSGIGHTVARTSDGRMFIWGFNQEGQLGDGTVDNQNRANEMTQFTGAVTIHYTTNGSDPTEDDPSIISGASLPINQSLALKARAFKSGWTPSAVQTATFTISAQAAQTIQLTGATFSLNESEGKATVTINRSGSTAGAASVNYATSDSAGLNECNVINGVASSRCDYATTLGTLRFAAGEASKTIFIPIVNDGYAEGNETFSIALSNPVGATLGSFTTANVTIQDNESANGANPLDAVDFFIEQHYIDFLGRNPEPAGLAGWRNVLNNCGVTVAPPCDRIEVSAGFFRSPEFQARGYFVYRLYSSVGRIPLYPEFMPDFAKVSGFLSDAQLEANKAAFVTEFMNRTEFQTKYSSTFTNPTAYVDALLQTVGLPSHPTRGTWISYLNTSNTSQRRGDVLRGLVESQQVYDKYYQEAFVIMQYFGYLRRTADASYLQWINTMNQTNGDYRTMINGFLNSAEYRKRFGP